MLQRDCVFATRFRVTSDSIQTETKAVFTVLFLERKKKKKRKGKSTKVFVRVVTLSSAPELGATLSFPRRNPSNSARARQTQPGQL